MMRRITVATIAFAVLAVGAPAAEAGKLRSQYRGLYEKVADTHGKRAPGRNIVEDGVRTKRGVRQASRADIKKSIGVFQYKLAPPPAASSTSTAGSTSGFQSAVSSTGSSSGACGNAIPGYIIDRESGGNPNARNPSGAFGCYQLMPMHFEPGGECAGLGTNQSGQDKCAARLWDGGRGSSHWAATR